MSTITAVMTDDPQAVPAELIARIQAAGKPTAAHHVGRELCGSCALAAAILPITAEDELDRQPLHLADRGIRVLLAGRLDNRAELMTGLGWPGGVGSPAGPGMSDAGLAAAAYARWGPECAARLIGAFALIVWDERERRLFCTTDHLASRPLYYARVAGRLVVASTIRQVRADPAVDAALDDGFLLASLTIPSVAPLLDERTPFAVVRRIPPGSTMSARPGGPIRTRRYWRPEAITTDRRAPDELAADLRERLEVAVRAQLRSRSKVAITLSGGLDSSSIACLAARTGGVDFGTFAFTYPEAGEIDEAGFRDRVVEQYDLRPTELKIRTWIGRGLFGDDTVASPVPDEPFAAVTARHQFTEAAMFAAGAGYNAILYGVGGDELMSGNENHLADLLRGLRLRTFARGVGAFGRMPNRTYLSTALLSGLAPIFRNRMTGRALLRGTEGRPKRPEAWWLPGWPSWVVGSERAKAEVRSVLTGLPERWISAPGRAQCAESLYRNASLPQWNDSVFQPFGVEMRCPFYDRRVVELAMAIPEQHKLRLEGDRFFGKLILREAMTGVLPEEVRMRKGKAAFDALAHLGAEREGPGLLGSGTFEVVERGYVDPTGLDRALRTWRVGRWADLPRLSLLFTVESWLRRIGSV